MRTLFFIFVVCLDKRIKVYYADIGIIRGVVVTEYSLTIGIG